MKQFFLKTTFAILSVILFYGCSQEPYDWSEGENSIKVKSFVFNEISQNSVNISFDLISSKDINPDNLYFYIKCKNTDKSSESITYDVEVTNLNGTNTIDLTGLESGVSYYLEFLVAMVQENDSYEENSLYTSSFKTIALYDLMPSPTSISLTPEKDSPLVNVACTLQIPENSKEIKEAGFFYGTDSKVTLETGTKVEGFIDGTIMVAELNQLDIDYTYYVGAYIITDAGTLTSGISSVTTNGVPFYIKVTHLERSVYNNRYGFTLAFDIYGISENTDCIFNRVRIRAARESYIELYGMAEVEFGGDNYEQINPTSKEENIYHYDYSKTNFGMFDKNYIDTRCVWFIIDWIDKYGIKHSSTIKNGNSYWKI